MRIFSPDNNPEDEAVARTEGVVESNSPNGEGIIGREKFDKASTQRRNQQKIQEAFIDSQRRRLKWFRGGSVVTQSDDVDHHQDHAGYDDK